MPPTRTVLSPGNVPLPGEFKKKEFTPVDKKHSRSFGNISLMFYVIKIIGIIILIINHLFSNGGMR